MGGFGILYVSGNLVIFFVWSFMFVVRECNWFGWVVVCIKLFIWDFWFIGWSDCLSCIVGESCSFIGRLVWRWNVDW